MKILVLFLSLTFLVGGDDFLLQDLQDLDDNKTDKFFFNAVIPKISNQKFMIDKNVGFVKFANGQNFVKFTYEIFDSKIINFSQIKQDELKNFLSNLDKFNRNEICFNSIFAKIFKNKKKIITEYFYKNKKLFSNSLKCGAI